MGLNRSVRRGTPALHELTTLKLDGHVHWRDVIGTIGVYYRINSKLSTMVHSSFTIQGDDTVADLENLPWGGASRSIERLGFTTPYT